MAGTAAISLKVVLSGLILAVLYLLAQRSREAISPDNLSRKESLSVVDCFDGGSESIACAAKLGVKAYVFNLRGGYVERARQRAYDVAFNKGITDGVPINAAREKATRLGKEAGKLASRKHKRYTGPALAGSWDFFEVLYYGGSFIEGLTKGVGALAGTYWGGILGEQRINWPSNRIGYLLGSQIGSWFGAQVGIMIYDICNGAHLLRVQLTDFMSGTTSETSEFVGAPDNEYIDTPIADSEYAFAEYE